MYASIMTDRHRELQTEINFTHRSNVQTKLRKQVKCTCRRNETIRKTHSLHRYRGSELDTDKDWVLRFPLGSYSAYSQEPVVLTMIP